jgi:hypothetical protein
VTTNDQNQEPPSAAHQRVRRYRLAGVVVLLLGLVSAGVIYWLGSRAPDFSDDPSMVGFNRSEERQMGILYGKQGQLIEDLKNSLKQPGTQAMLTVAAAGVVATGCFYFARLLANEAKQNGAPGVARRED